VVINNLFFVVCIFWIVSEILWQILVRSKKGSEDKDLGSVKILNLVIYLPVAIGVFAAFTQYGNIRIDHSRM